MVHTGQDQRTLTLYLGKFGLQLLEFIELAGEVNASMPHYVVGRMMEALNEDGKALTDPTRRDGQTDDRVIVETTP